MSGKRRSCSVSAAGWRRLAALALVAGSPLAAAGCGSEVAPTSPSESVGSQPAEREPVDPELAERAHQAGLEPDLVYVVDVDGYDRAAGGTGPYGDSGFQDIYVSPSGADIRLTVERAALDDADCPDLPIPAAEPVGVPVACVSDGDGWERTSGDRQEYARLDGGRLVRVSGRTDATTMDLLRSAVADARPATADELDDLLPAGPTGGSSGRGTPARGDLPATGDGAPDNSVGPGG